jgi:WD40 repeat protein
MLALFVGHHGSVEACSWADDGRQVVSAGADMTLRVWNSENGEEMAVLEGSSDCASTANGDMLVTAGRNDALKIYRRGCASLTFFASGAISRISVSPDGKRIAAGDRLGSVYLLRIVPSEA